MHDSAWAEGAEEPLIVLRVVAVLHLNMRVKVIKIAQKLVKAVYGWQKIVAVTQVVLAMLAGGISLLLKELGQVTSSDDSRGASPQARPWAGPPALRTVR